MPNPLLVRKQRPPLRLVLLYFLYLLLFTGSDFDLPPTGLAPVLSLCYVITLTMRHVRTTVP